MNTWGWGKKTKRIKRLYALMLHPCSFPLAALLVLKMFQKKRIKKDYKKKKAQPGGRDKSANQPTIATEEKGGRNKKNKIDNNANQQKPSRLPACLPACLLPPFTSLSVNSRSRHSSSPIPQYINNNTLYSTPLSMTRNTKTKISLFYAMKKTWPLKPPQKAIDAPKIQERKKKKTHKKKQRFRG
ncbi:hypothetical protein B0T24DRAFT_323031 [Lasiosphaeria ovina]|uniref:Uncharacterized protein n=1 Tax=Lasiosphaeria ovina TaxID=92902 RepID=A0AAE0K7K2_9PEZI|nr:hypothetical protein B0T24DRAFT_323031 [Lasiosphaeria ovina]